MHSGRLANLHPPSPPLSKDEALKDIGQIMNIGNLILGVNSVVVSYLICYDGLLQNATDVITKCNRLLLQNAIVIANWRRFYYKMRQLIQNATFITKFFRVEKGIEKSFFEKYY